MIKYYLIITCFFLFQDRAVTQENINANRSDSLNVVNQLNRFLAAFRNLDYESFQSYFADDVTAFFPPSAMVNGRIDGKENVMKVFKAFFDKVKAGKSGPPYLDIIPKKMTTSIVNGLAIVIFELDESDGGLGRRTIILQKRRGRYLIIHIHASKVIYKDPHSGT